MPGVRVVIASVLLSIACEVAGQQCSNEGAVRLVDGMTENEGRVEICYSRRWSAVCGTGWDRIEARITCGELGFQYGAPVDHGRISDQIYRPRFSCDGHETHLQYCSYSAYCYSSEDAGVICQSSQCNETDVRLVDGRLSNANGRVEICFNGLWGSVCDDCGMPEMHKWCADN
ncbi:Neurotrypsin [Geodia barretti]|uniref:Neurotrypsin n=2 Tax=Geodia barretti TaxID=519541 RepID=A0AA35WD75_GEOBA|nr:Neurotrypsin [Geodia barretti]